MSAASTSTMNWRMEAEVTALEGLKRSFGGWSPVESQLGGREGCEGGGNGAVVPDETPVEISEHMEPLKLLMGVGKGPGGNC